MTTFHTDRAAPPPSGRLLKLVDVVHETSLSKSEIYRRIHAGTFPGNYAVGGRCRRWAERDIEAWKRAVLPAASDPDGGVSGGISGQPRFTNQADTGACQ